MLLMVRIRALFDSRDAFEEVSHHYLVTVQRGRESSLGYVSIHTLLLSIESLNSGQNG